VLFLDHVFPGSGARSAQADKAEQSQNDDDGTDDVDDLGHGGFLGSLDPAGAACSGRRFKYACAIIQSLNTQCVAS
jgi:hypothetical protein